MKRTAKSFRFTGLLVTAGLLLICSVFPYVGLPLFYVQQAFLLFFFAGLAQSWNILGGYGGYLSLGHAAFVGIGGYTVAILFKQFGLSPFITFPAAAIMAALLSIIIGAVCFRIRGSYFLIATMLVLFILQSLGLNLRTLTNGSDGIDMPLFTSDYRVEAFIWYYCSLVLLVAISAASFLVERSIFGLNLMAIREDEDAARTMGVRTVRTKALAFALSAGLAGLLGAMYTYHAHLIEPIGAFSLDLSAIPILMAILGGTSSWTGPLLGAAAYQAFSTTLAVSFGNQYSNVVFSVFLIVVVLLLPRGLIGLVRRIRPVFAERDIAGGEAVRAQP